MNLTECYKQKFIRKTIQNKELTKSLFEMSNIKEKIVLQQILDENNISAFFPMAYDSLRELMESLCTLYGYKITNHICLGELVKKLLPEFDFILFDRLRYARNSINYYGEKIELEQGKELISKMFKLKEYVQNELNKLLNN